MRTCTLTNQRGYTILELIISITMIGIILLIIGMTMRLSFRSVDSGEKRIWSSERFRTSLGIVDAQLQSLLPVQQGETDDDTYLFKGTPDSMEFSSNYSLWNGGGYIKAVYKVKSDGYGKEELHVKENTIGLEEKGDVRLFDLFDHIYFEYFYKDPTEENGSWVDQWPTTDSVPEKVRLHLVKEGVKVALIIPIRVRELLNKKQQTKLGALGAPGPPALPVMPVMPVMPAFGR